MKKIIFLVPIFVMLFLFEMIFLSKVPLASDTISHKPIANWNKEYSKDNSVSPFWYPYLFSCMPAFGSHIKTPGNPFNRIMNLFLLNRGLNYWFHFSSGGLGLFIVLLFYHKQSRLAIQFGGLIFSLRISATI